MYNFLQIASLINLGIGYWLYHKKQYAKAMCHIGIALMTMPLSAY